MIAQSIMVLTSLRDRTKGDFRCLDASFFFTQKALLGMNDLEVISDADESAPAQK